MKRFRVLYGAGPLNLLVLLFCFAIAGVAVMGWFQRPKDVETVIEWFIASVLLHDLLFVPVYTVLDRIALSWVRRLGGRPRTVLGVVNATPYLRIPAILSGLLLLVFFPVIFGFGSQSELDASGIAESGYLARWLIASGVLFAVSGVTWGATLARAAAGRGGAREREPVAVAGPVPRLTRRGARPSNPRGRVRWRRATWPKPRGGMRPRPRATLIRRARPIRRGLEALGAQAARSGARANSAIPARKSARALKPSSRSVRSAEANT